MTAATRVRHALGTMHRSVLLGAALLAASVAAAAPPAQCPPQMPPPSAVQWQAAQSGARDHGFLWRISKAGHDSYLYGTIHVGKLEWSFPGPALSQALAHSDTLALELDLGDPAVAQQVAAAVARKDNASELPAALRLRLARQIAAACLPEDALQGLHPVMQAISLTLLAARRDALDAGYAQELMLAREARAARRDIVSLESVAQQLGAMLPEDEDEARAMLEDTLEDLELGRARPTLRRLAQAWADGDMAALESYPQWCDCLHSEEQRRLLTRLNDERNAPLADAIDALHGQGRKVLAAVGALHMSGALALPRLMAQRGYTVQRVGLRSVD
jgi:uncharacterized protein YbaP (TraB family)